MTKIIGVVSIISAIFATDKIAKIVKLQSDFRFFLWFVVGMILSFVFFFILIWVFNKILGKERYEVADKWIDRKIMAIAKGIVKLAVACFCASCAVSGTSTGLYVISRGNASFIEKYEAAVAVIIGLLVFISVFYLFDNFNNKEEKK